MKKLIYVCMLLLLVCLFTGCKAGEKGSGMAQSSDLLTKGDEIVSLMNEMVRSEDYQAAMNPGVSLQSEVEKIAAGDYTKASAVYEIRIPDDTYENIMQVGLDGAGKDDLSADLYAYLEQKMLSSIALQINARYIGTSALAASSIFTATKTFVNTELENGTIYLYTFEHGYPVMISFVRGDDGTVSAIGYFIMDSDLSGATQKDVENMLGNTMFLMDAHVKKIR